MEAHWQGRLGHYLGLAGCSALLFFANLGGATLWDLDEGRNATAALEMMESGDYIVPTFNGELRDHKPALLYWLQILAYYLFGVNEFAARLPSALAAFGTVLLVYELGRSLFNPATGFLGGLIVASAPMMVGAARFANPDALLHFFTVFNLTIFYFGYRRPTAMWYVGLGITAGLAVLAKGPVGVVLPGFVEVAFVAWERRWRIVFQRRTLWALAAGLAVAMPWYIWVTALTKGDFLFGFLLNHNANRFLSPMENHHGFPGFYVVVLFLGLMPWSIFLGLACWFGFWSAFERPNGRGRILWEHAADQSAQEDVRTSRYRFLGLWLLTYLLFFSVAATKLPNYVLPAVAPTALLLGRFLDRWRREEIRLASGWIGAGLAGLAAVGIVVAVGFSTASGSISLPALKGRVYPALALWALIGIGPVLAAGAGWWCLHCRRRTGMIVCLACAALLLLGPLAGWASAVFNRHKAPCALVEQSGAGNRESDIRIGCWQLAHLPSLNFYCQRQVIHHGSEEEAVAFLEYPLPVFLFMPQPEWLRLQGRAKVPWREVGRHHDLYRHVDVLVIANH